MFWLDEQVQLLKGIDSTWDLIRTTLNEKIENSTLKQKQLLSNWFNHLTHIYDELKEQQNWEPKSPIRRKIIAFLKTFSILKHKYPATSPIWTDVNPVWPVSSFVQCNTIYGFDLHVSGADLWSVTATGHYKQELGESLVILRLLPRMELFIDVGANIGFYSLLAAKTTKESFSVVAFEPQQQNYLKMLTAIEANGVGKKIQAIPTAISSNSQKQKLFHCTLGSGGHSIDPPPGAPVSEEYEIVESTTLDDVQKKYCPHFSKTLIKIDVECFEYEVLCGASQWLSSQVAPVILFETNKVSKHSTTKNHVLVIKKLQSNGYRVYPIQLPANGRAPLGKRCAPFNYKSQTINYLALPPYAYDLLSTINAPIDVRVFTRKEHLKALLIFLKNSLNSLETE